MDESRQTIMNEIQLRLGHYMIDVELDLGHLNLAIDKALERYRQRSENAVEEDFIVMELQPHTLDYKLPKEIVEVRDIYQRAAGVGGFSSTDSSSFDAFHAGYIQNQFYHRAGGAGAGSLALFDALAQHHEVLGRLFVSDFNLSGIAQKINYISNVDHEQNIPL